MNLPSRVLVVRVLLAAFLAVPCAAPAATPAAASAESRTARYFVSIRHNPNLLLPFLRDMPKGGDLHNHLSGAIYAESFLQWAADAGDCIDSTAMSIHAAPCDPPLVPAANSLHDPGLYGRLIDAFSMRNWQYSGQSGHDHFFNSFGKFSAIDGKSTGRMLAETANRAVSQHEVYQELMLTPTGGDLDALAKQEASHLGWDDDFGIKHPATNADFERMQQALLAGGLSQMLDRARQDLKTAEQQRDQAMNCGLPTATPGCQIEQRYLFQVARGKAKAVVFAEILSGFLMAGGDPAAATPEPHMLGLNLVMPEDWYVPMTDFPLHMQMLAYLHQRYPRVHLSLHAGELVEGLVPPEGLQFHVRDSVEMAHAERIGHGVDAMNETDPARLLSEMAQRNVMVEICLTSNAVILGVSGKQHPLSEYIRAGVPVALATDDEGVARSDMTHEYLRGAEDQDLTYPQLKKMARTSLEHAFLPGASLWRDGKTFVMVKECAADVPGYKSASGACQKLLDASEKARLQWKLESQFRDFEERKWSELPAK